MAQIINDVLSVKLKGGRTAIINNANLRSSRITEETNLWTFLLGIICVTLIKLGRPTLTLGNAIK